MSSSNQPTVVIDDANLHYNTSRDAAQATPPSSAVSDSVAGAKTSPWNNTLVVVTTPTSFWYNVTGYSRVAVYGALIPPTSVGVTAWANYTIDGNYTAANITTSAKIITDFPLFTSVELDPNQQYDLTADIWASPDAPYLLDYVLAFSPPKPVPVSTSSTTSSTSSSTMTASSTESARATSAADLKIPHPVVFVGALAGVCALLLALLLVTCCCWCRARKSKPNKIEEPAAPEPPFPPRPTMTKSATLVSTKASRRGDSFYEPPLASSTTTLAPESAPPPVAGPGPTQAPRPPTTYAPENVQFAGPGASYHRSMTMPTQQNLQMSSPMVQEMPRQEGLQRSVSPYHLLPHAASKPRLHVGTRMPSGMSSPPAIQLPTPFELPPAGEILTPESPLHNPYDDLYGHMDNAPSGPAVTPEERFHIDTSHIDTNHNRNKHVNPSPSNIRAARAQSQCVYPSTRSNQSGSE
ncbi:hypothetical protein DICSQDRAFT_129448 [Dichomitus squalens LYAD-421 SS1]|uniref:Uncharacterized protein n=1 Tax=Dichomitus squalens (strain LYAD-421) TaxID=732165 RepID=R7SRF5_DICSQ|nr:uncharacterized protein DICSQDRAFT_129448 [Dichomitus squalens LYAD-421 SS1]EJF57557.1 hypothetical protein DICSQDRAFT_129448 [Dichomitus squalens LYAD-421 SS1]